MIIALGMIKIDSVGLLVQFTKFSKGLQPVMSEEYMPNLQ